MRRRLRQASDRPDDGMTLAELLVYMVLLLVVMGMATVLFIDVIRTQSEITVMAQENNEAQLLFEQLERDVRNAGWVEVRHGGDLAVMRVRTASDGADTTEICVGYYFNDATHTLHTTRSTSATDTAAVLGASSQSVVVSLAAEWPGYQTNLDRIAGSRVFGQTDERIDSPESVAMKLVANASGDKKQVVFDKTVQLRPQSGFTGGCA